MVFKPRTNAASKDTHIRSEKCKFGADAIAAYISHLERAADAPPPLPPAIIPRPFPPTPSDLPPPPRQYPCAGYFFKWGFGDFWKDYPWQLHSLLLRYKTPYFFVSIDPPNVRHERCHQVVNELGICCKACAGLSLEINIHRERAARPQEGVQQHDHLTWAQLRSRLAAKDEQINSLWLEIANLRKALGRSQAHSEKLEELFGYLQTTSVPALYRILRNAGKEGWSAELTLRECRRAVAGKYHPENWLDWEVDLAMLVYEIGGLSLVHAFNHSMLLFPSRNTLQKTRRDHNLHACISGVRFTDVYDNVSTYFAAETQTPGDQHSPIVRYLHTACFDETAKTATVDYFPETDEFGGLCLEHLRELLKDVQVGDTVEVLEQAAQLVRDGKLHVGSEISVGAIFSHSETNYGAKPVFLGPSCKKGNWFTVLLVVLTVLEVWERHPEGAAKRGPISSVSSDGDAKRRVAFFLLCMLREVKEDDAIYEHLKDVIGLNLFTGKNNLTMDFDAKHELKRFGTTLRSPEGILVKGIQINRDLLLKWLERLTCHDFSEVSIQALLNPIDAQDVPRAVKLLIAIIDLKSLEKDASEFNPTEVAQLEALRLLGALLDALLAPLTDPTLDLTTQITSLLKFSYMLCAMYVQHGTSFIPNQLYGDLQAMVKNAVFMVAKTRLLNPELKVFICLLGDDVLETLFGRCRMIGGHNPTTSLAEFLRYCSSAMHLDSIFQRRPEQERNPTRLSYARIGHVDHLRPSDWRNCELRAKTCNLGRCSAMALAQAVATLEMFHAPLTVVDGVERRRLSFTALFLRPQTDLLRPNGWNERGRYPSVAGGADRSRMDGAADDATADVDLDAYTYRDPYAGYSTAEIIERELIVPLLGPQEKTAYARVDVDADKRVHKSSAVRIIFDMFLDFKQAHDRLYRVRGFSAGGKLSWMQDNTPGGVVHSPSTHFQLGDVFTTLISHNGVDIGLAVATAISIKHTNGSSTSAILRSDLHLPSSPYTIRGQTLSLSPLPHTTSDPNAPTIAWVWDQSFVEFLLNKKAKTTGVVSRTRNVVIDVPSRLAEPFTERSFEFHSADLPIHMFGTQEKTWYFMHEDLRDAWAAIWGRLEKDSSLGKRIPRFHSVKPGDDAAGNCFPSVVASADTQSLVIPASETSISTIFLDACVCPICGKAGAAANRQKHMGKHILLFLLGVHESKAKHSVSRHYPCGYCGGSGCSISIGAKGNMSESNCPLFHPFRATNAGNSTVSNPCTNTPIKCPFETCRETHWKYNFPLHFRDKHQNWRVDFPPDSSFIAGLVVSNDEQAKSAVPVLDRRLWLTLFPSPPALGTIPILPLPPSTPSRRFRSASTTPSRRDRGQPSPRPYAVSPGSPHKRRRIDFL